MATGTPPSDFYNPDPMVMGEDPALSAPPMQVPAQPQATGGVIEQAIVSGSGENDPVQQRARRQLSIQPPDYGYRVTNNDFYATPGMQVVRSTPGEYGSIPIPLPSAPRVAMAPLAMRGQQLRRRQEELDAQLANLDPTGGLDKAPAPYLKGQAQLWDSEYQGLIKNWEAAKGSRLKALREIATPGSEANQQYKMLKRDHNILAAQLGNTFDKAAKLNAALDEGSYVTDPTTADLSRRLESGAIMLSPDNYKEVASLVAPLEGRLGVYEYLDSIKADDQAKVAIQEIQSMPRRNGAYDVQEQRKLLGDFREKLITHLAPKWKGFVEPSVIREIIESKYPDDLIVDWSRVPVSGSGASAEADRPLSAQYGPLHAEMVTDGKIQRGGMFKQVSLPPTPMALVNEQGFPVQVSNAKVIEGKDGKRYIYGETVRSDRNIQSVSKETLLPEPEFYDGEERISESKYRDLLRNGRGDPREVKYRSTTSYVEHLPDGTTREVPAAEARKDIKSVTLPYDQNAGTIDNVLGRRYSSDSIDRALGSVSAPAAQKKAPYGQTVVQNGVTYTWDPESGEYK